MDQLCSGIGQVSKSRCRWIVDRAERGCTRKREKIKTEVILGKAYTEPKAAVYTAAVTPEVREAHKRLNTAGPQIWAGQRGGKLGVLDLGCFVRISDAEIINLKKVQNFDFSITGRIGAMEVQTVPTTLMSFGCMVRPVGAALE
jgi:hypothetical protein